MLAFSREKFEATEPAAVLSLCQGLAELLSHRFAGLGLDWSQPYEGSALSPAEDAWGDCGYAIIEELRAIGHDLWSLDAGVDFQVWGGDYSSPPKELQLFLMFHPQAEVEVTWEGVSVRTGSCLKGCPTDASGADATR